MAPQVKYLAAGVAVLFAALSRHADAAAVTSVATNICVASINKARAAKLDVRLPVVTVKAGAPEPLAGAKAALADPNDNTTCTLKASTYPTTSTIAGFMIEIKKATASLTDADCDAVIQKEITDALTQIGTDEAKPFKANTAPYTNTNVAAQNFGYFMDSKATQIACAVTDNCADNNSFIVCNFYPAIDTTQGVVPFPADFYAAVKARSTAGVKIQDLTNSDIGKGLTGGGSGSGSLAISAVVLLPFLGLLNL